MATDPLTRQQRSMAGAIPQALDGARASATGREQERNASDRAAELQQANDVLRRTVSGTVTGDHPDDLLGRMLLEISAVTGAYNAAVLLTDRTTSLLGLRVMTTNGKVVDAERDDRYAIWRNPVDLPTSSNARDTLGDGLVTGSPEALHDLLWPPSIEWHRAMGHQQLMMGPLRYRGEVVGVLGLAFRESVELDPGRRDLLVTLGQQMSLVIAHDRATHEARDVAIMREREAHARARAADLERASTAMQRMNDALATLDGLHAFVPEALRVAAEAFGARTAGFFEHLDEAVYLRFWLQDGRVYGPQELPELDANGFALASTLGRGFTVPNDHLGTPVRDRKAPVIVDHRRPRVPSRLHDFAVDMGWDWELNVPLLIDGEADAAFTLHRPQDRPFTPEEVALAVVLSKQVALAVQASRAAERARLLALMAERNRLAADIHDSLAQSFTSIALQSEVLASTLPEGSAAQRTVTVIERTARRGLAEARASVHTLRTLPGTPGALQAALAELAEHCSVRGAVECRLEQPPQHCPLQQDGQEAALRVAQEAANNALRHSGCKTLSIRLEWDATEVTLRVDDDGRGLPAGGDSTGHAQVHGGGYGLAGMRERAAKAGGRLLIDSAPGRGTRVTLCLPRADQPGLQGLAS